MSKYFANIKVKTLPNSEAEITGELALECLRECRTEALKELGKRVNLPGFRTGHIPDEVLVKNVGEMRILEETAEIALGREYGNILKEAKLLPITRPEVAITKLAPGIPLEFKIKVALEPEFALPDYKKLSQEVVEEDKEKKRLKIIESLVKATEIPLPAVLIQGELEKMLTQFKDDVAKASIKWEDYLKSISKTEEDIKTEWSAKAIERVKAELIIGKISQAEKIEPTKDEVEHEAKHLLEHYPEADPLRARIYVYGIMRNQKVLEFLEALR